jgi:outer membrane protein TolC
MQAGMALGLSLVLWVSVAAAAPVEGDGALLPPHPTLDDYLLYAHRHNPALEAAWQRYQAALNKEPQVRALPDPRLSYAYQIRRIETRVGPQRWSLGLMQMFPWPGKRDLAGQAAAAAARGAHELYGAAGAELTREVKDAYYAYHYLARSMAVVQRMQELTRYHEGVARARYKTGVAHQSALTRAQVMLGRLIDRVRSLEEMRAPAMARLNAALDRPVDAELPWPQRGPDPDEAPALSDEDVLALVRAHNDKVLAMHHETERRGKLVELAGKADKPDVTLGVSYIDTADARVGNPPRSGRDPVVASVSLNLPIWREKYRAAELEAAAAWRAAERREREMANAVTRRARRVLFEFQDAGRKVDLYRETLVPMAERARKATEAAFKAGEATFQELLETQNALLELELASERALTDRAQRLAELDMLAGQRLRRRSEAPPKPAAESTREEQTTTERGPTP